MLAKGVAFDASPRAFLNDGSAFEDADDGSRLSLGHSVPTRWRPSVGGLTALAPPSCASAE